MKIQYLGTAAAEGWPALFCKCEACEQARKSGGKDIRTRSQSLVDDCLLIDFPADTYYHALKYNIDFPAIEHIIITHSHEDHFYPLDMILKSEPYAYAGKASKINVYGNKVVVEALTNAMNASGIMDIDKFISPIYIKPFIPFQAGEYTITPLLTDHMQNEDAYIYIVEKCGDRMLYAHDTGLFPQKTLEYINQTYFNFVSLDCTFQLTPWKHGHMGFPNNEIMKNVMASIGCADINTKFAINHFSHNGMVLHNSLENHAAKSGFITAYDGLTVDF